MLMIPQTSQQQALPIVLRDWCQEDLAKYRYWLQPNHTWQQFDGPYYPHFSEAEIDERLQKVADQMAVNNWPEPRTNLVIANEKNEMIGLVSRYWQSRETWWLSVGIDIFSENLWGKGLGKMALGLWCQYLWDQFPDIIRLDLRTWSGNTGMMRLAEKLGFQQEAVFRKARIVSGCFFDGLGYGILREEWEELYPRGFLAASIKG